MGTRLNPYMHFAGNAREAMEFYKTALGGELEIMTFSQGGMAEDPAEADKVMHGQLVTPKGFWLMGADTPARMGRPSGASVDISLSGDDEAELRGYWDALSEGATIEYPLDKAPWGDSFGQLKDKFGISWLVNIAGQH